MFCNSKSTLSLTIRFENCSINFGSAFCNRVALKSCVASYLPLSAAARGDKDNLAIQTISQKIIMVCKNSVSLVDFRFELDLIN